MPAKTTLPAACKLVALDLDGTLLRGTEKISAYSASVLRRCSEAGIRLVIDTARPYRRVVPYLDAAPWDAVICHGGASVWFGGERDPHFCIPAETAAGLLRALHGGFAHMPVIADCREELFADFDTTQLWPEVRVTQTDFSDFPGREVESILAGVDGTATVQQVLGMLPEGIRLDRLGPGFIRIRHLEADKRSALRYTAAKLGLALADAVAFGDDRADAGMLYGAGLGVAVKNAGEEALAAADAVCRSNAEDGPAHFLEENVLGA